MLEFVAKYLWVVIFSVNIVIMLVEHCKKLDIESEKALYLSLVIGCGSYFYWILDGIGFFGG